MGFAEYSNYDVLGLAKLVKKKKVEPSELVEIFRTLRLLNLALWRQTSPEDLKRTSQHNERGPESLEVMLRLLAGHDLSHLAQINRYLQAIQQQQ